MIRSLAPQSGTSPPLRPFARVLLGVATLLALSAAFVATGAVARDAARQAAIHST